MDGSGREILDLRSVAKLSRRDLVRSKTASAGSSGDGEIYVLSGGTRFQNETASLVSCKIQRGNCYFQNAYVRNGRIIKIRDLPGKHIDREPLRPIA